MRALLFWSFVFTAVFTGAALAHLFELPNKMPLAGPDYFVVQQVYSGWVYLSIPIFGALLLTFLLAMRLRRGRRGFGYALTAFLCIALSQVVFWLFTFPVNQATGHWTTMPPDWIQLRTRWEYSHAVVAALDFLALISLFQVALRRGGAEA